MANLSRSASYRAAARGEIPVMKFGRKRCVPKGPWLRKLGVEV